MRRLGTAVRQIKSRADQFSLIMHGQKGEGEDMEGFLRKECAQVCGTHPVCPRSYSRIFAAAYGAAICSLIRKSLTLGFQCGTTCSSILKIRKSYPRISAAAIAAARARRVMWQQLRQ